MLISEKKERRMGEFAAFAEAERSGWANTARASGYVGLFAAAADRLVDPLLEAAGAKSGLQVLDLCCGQGNVAEALAVRGCKVSGVDFSPAMLAFARARVRDACFVEGDAENLPFGSEEFDIVVSNVGICHVPDQRRALAEVKRVLRQGGRFAMSVWCGPDRSPSYDIVYRAIKTHGAAGIAAPPGPDFHQFANRKTAHELLSAAGFSNVEMSIVESGWSLDRPDAFFEIFARGTVRAAMLLALQPAENLAAIRSALVEEVRLRFADGPGWRVPTMAAVLSATA
jgi:SAM-dependent methyltransferase